MDIFKPTWQDLSSLISGARSDLLICSPFYSGRGIGRIFDHFNSDARLRFWTLISPTSWLDGSSDPEQLLALVDLLSDEGSAIEIGVVQRLHAKVYAADRDVALLGSANLSEAGFGQSLEAMVRFEGADAAAVVDFTEGLCESALRSIDRDHLRMWIADAKKTIEQLRVSDDRGDPADALSEVQRSLDELLRMEADVESIRSLPDVPPDFMWAFVSWLRTRGALAGASMLIRRFDNLDGHNLTGHCRQAFFGAWRFFDEHPELVSRAAESIRGLEQDDVYRIGEDDDLLAAWVAHLNNHAMDVGENFKYGTLRGYLPPSVGGTRLNGGGGISTFKRMLPLVAEYRLE